MHNKNHLLTSGAVGAAWTDTLTQRFTDRDKNVTGFNSVLIVTNRQQTVLLVGHTQSPVISSVRREITKNEITLSASPNLIPFGTGAIKCPDRMHYGKVLN